MDAHCPAPLFPPRIRHLLQTMAVILLLLPVAGHACSICGCSLISDWDSQLSDSPGLSAAFRYEYISQSNLRSGPHSADTAAFTFPNAVEIQQATLSRNVWLDVDYIHDAVWSLLLQVPYHDRDHSTIVAGDTAVSTSHASGVGDVRLSVRHQWMSPGHTSGLTVQLGLKLPSGSTRQNFATGPAAGTPLDRALQLGTGTTDLLASIACSFRPGLYYNWYAQATLTQPLDAKDGFQPSSSLGLNLGVRRLTSGWITPQLQLNARRDSRESGVNSDVPNSGGTFIYLSPGLSAELGTHGNAYVSVQLPVFQQVNGLQLQPRWLLAGGMRWQF